MDEQEKLQKVFAITVEIEKLSQMVKGLGASRPLSMVLTKLEEAELWLTKELV